MLLTVEYPAGHLTMSATIATPTIGQSSAAIITLQWLQQIHTDVGINMFPIQNKIYYESCFPLLYMYD